MKKIRKYIVTDDCSFEKLKNYPNKNKKRNPHFVTLVDIETGTVIELKSGSIINIVREK